MSQPYVITTRENGKQIGRVEAADPFHNTTVRPRGWHAALAVLRRRYEIVVNVNAPRELVERVLELDPDYRGIPGSKRRLQCDKEMNAALSAFADGLTREDEQ